MNEGDLYADREQTLVKHFILEHYLERFAHIVGSAWDAITYVDCFAGPWNARSEHLEDSSFALALAQLRAARTNLADLKLARDVLQKAHLLAGGASFQSVLLAFVVEQALDRVGGDAFERALKLVNSVGQATRRAVYSNVAGTLAETAAGIKGPKISIPGLGRIPDEIGEGLVREVKFREGRHLDLSAQLQEIADWAANKGLRFELEVPVGTTFGKGLQELIDQGKIIVKETLP